MTTPALRGILLAGLASLLAASVEAADCVPGPTYLIEYEVLACQPAEVVLVERIAGADLWWLRPYLENIAQGNPGVILTGKRLRMRDVDRQASIFAWDEGDGTVEQIFYTASDPDFCGAFDGLEAVTLRREEPCCDIVPPANVACVLDVAEVRPVVEEPPAELGPASFGAEPDASGN